ncbi:hypothetical protein Kisp01_27730 [Kineosporia sp. NBRC 101677]|uniref:hypothetical protein n=1 Tax=Kineosporia sp. NBRC 101677 TaxID=3032197 RepID=UPI0024A14721|nr:hypothetical protein [Kineosporia sp. NBRC 101677]GLY15758.1 hypothetical protein Kisp01_27730 [Kineosporia sp. NBRC 101677]
MNKRTFDSMTNAALRDLDPAGPAELSDAEHERADATLARILATPVHEQAPQTPDRPRRRRGRLLLPVGLGGAAVTALLLSGGGSALASWTPKPQALTGAAKTEAVTACRGAFGRSDRGEPAVIAERRGGWTYVIMNGPKENISCLMSDKFLGQGDPADTTVGFMGGYDSDPVEAPSVAPDSLVETESAGSSFSLPGRWPFTTDDGYVEWVQGYVGSNVTGVTVHPPVGPDVEASVNGGQFATWWPRGVLKGDHPGMGGAWSYTVTLADGTTRLITKDIADD